MCHLPQMRYVQMRYGQGPMVLWGKCDISGLDIFFEKMYILYGSFFCGPQDLWARRGGGGVDRPELKDRRFVEKRQYNVKQLWEAHHEMLRRLALGESNGEVARALGITPQTVSNIRNSPMGREKLNALQEGIDKDMVIISRRIEKFAPVALDLLEGIIEGREEEASIQLRAKSAESYLGRAGYGPVHKVHSLRETLSRSDIERIKERAINAARNAGALAVEYEEVRETGTG
jgi:transcriptional regulator with XRE-family HTH domain